MCGYVIVVILNMSFVLSIKGKSILRQVRKSIKEMQASVFLTEIRSESVSECVDLSLNFNFVSKNNTNIVL